jgi:hypothetical protein
MDIDKLLKNPYHTIRYKNKTYKGTRDCLDRIKKIDFNFMNGSIMDIGCNLGGMLWPYRYYCPWMVGVEDKDYFVDFCNHISKYYEVDWKTKFIQCDIDKHIDNLNYLGRFDVIFMFAVTQWLKNWKQAIKWCCNHSRLFFIEYNGQPPQVKEYIKYTRTLRNGLDYLGEFNGRFSYVCYNPIIFNLFGKTYNTYYYSSGANCDAYYSVKEDAIIKVYRNQRYEAEIEWSQKLKCGPEIMNADYGRDIVIQKYAGQFLTYYNMPDNFEKQIEDIKKDLTDNRCSGDNVELRVKDDRITLIDLGACKEDDLCGVIDKEKHKLLYLRKKYLSGVFVTAEKNDYIFPKLIVG